MRAPEARGDWIEPLSAWPGLDADAWTRWRVRIAEVCAAVLQGCQPPPLSASTAADARAAGIAAFSTGMGPLLGHWVERGIIAADPALATGLLEHLHQSRMRHRRLAGEAGRVLGALGAARVPTVLLKGLYTSRYFPEPGARAFSDVDLLIAPSDRSVAEAVLRDLAFTAGPAVDRSRRTWYPAGNQRLHSLELTHVDNPWSVDVHWALTRMRFRALTIRLPEVTPAACPPWDIAGVRSHTLPVPLLIAFLAIHAVEQLRVLQLVRLVELVLVIRAETASGTLAWPAVDEVLARHDARHYAYPALRLVERLVPGTVDPALLGDLERSSSPRLVRVVASLSPAGDLDPGRWSVVEPFLWARGPGEWLRVLWRQVWPGFAYGSPGDIAGFYARRFRRLWRRELRRRPAAAPSSAPTAAPR